MYIFVNDCQVLQKLLKSNVNKCILILGKVIFVIYPSIDKLLNVVDSKYQLVHISARRSKEMTATDHYQMKSNKYVSKKNIGRALEEIAENLITVKMETE